MDHVLDIANGSEFCIGGYFQLTVWKYPITVRAMNDTRARLIRKIDRWIAANKISPSEFGLMALNDTGFVKRLRDGKDVRLKTVERIETFMRKPSDSAKI